MKNKIQKLVFNHLTNDDRLRIEIWLKEDYSQIEIAKKLGVNRSTISREVKNRGTPSGYHAKIAQVDYQHKRLKCHPKNKIEETPIGSQVIAKIRAGWSPETISGRLEREIKHGLRSEKDFVTKETIYQFIYNSDFGREEKLYQYLRRGKKHRTRKFGRKSKKQVIPNRVFINERPSEIETRQSIGHWEGDTIHYAHKQGINSLVERKTRFALLTKLERRTAEETKQAVTSQLIYHHCQSLTVDNGSENSQHEEITKQLNMPVYFCHPYHSWEKGSNENFNGLVRRYLPKGSSLMEVTQEDLNDIANELNSRPRKILSYQTPKEVLEYEYNNLSICCN